MTWLARSWTNAPLVRSASPSSAAVGVDVRSVDSVDGVDADVSHSQTAPIYLTKVVLAQAIQTVDHEVNWYRLPLLQPLQNAVETFGGVRCYGLNTVATKVPHAKMFDNLVYVCCKVFRERLTSF